MKKITITLPKDVLNIITILEDKGYEAFAVGGCVRDSILGRQPKDWDVATNASPDVVMCIFPKTIETGLQHGTVTVMMGGTGYEVTTYRVDGEYLDGRHPARVDFTSSIKADLGRRDFTVNAMAYNSAVGLVDPFGGLTDLENKLIRAVGEPDKRFTEDALRMLRAVRFSAQLRFDLDGKVIEVMKQCSGLIRQISWERIRDELNGIIVSEKPEMLKLLHAAGLIDYIIPELSTCFETQQNHPYHIYNVGEHTLKAVEYVENTRLLRWAALLHDVGKPLCKWTDAKGIDHFYGHPEKSVALTRNILQRLRFDKSFIEKVLTLIKYHDLDIKPEVRSIKKAVIKTGDELFLQLLKLMEADKKAQNPEKLAERLERLNRIKAEYLKIKQAGDCLSLKDMAINGRDLIKIGYKEGKEMGSILEKLFQQVLKDPELNDRDRLLKIAESYRNN